MKKKVVITLMVATIITIIGLNIYRTRQENSVPVRTAQILQEDLEVSVFAVGRAVVGSYENIYSRISGTVDNVFIETGSVVQAGNIIATIDPTDLNHKLQEAQANLSTRQASLAEALAGPKQQDIALQQIALGQAQLSLKQAQERLEQALILQREGALPQQDVENARYEVNRKEMEVQSAEERLDQLFAGKGSETINTLRSQVKQAETNVALLEQQLAATTVRAATGGTVMRVSIEQGQYLATGAQIAQIADLTTLKIEAEIHEADAGMLTLGQTVNITGSAFLIQSYLGEVAKIAPAAVVRAGDQGRQTLIDVEISLKDRDTQIRPGYSVDLEIIVASKESALLVPYEAVLEDDDGHYVFVEADGRAQKRRVTLGLDNDYYLEIREGVNAGETVILSPSDEVVDSIRVSGTSAL